MNQQHSPPPPASELPGDESEPALPAAPAPHPGRRVAVGGAHDGLALPVVGGGDDGAGRRKGSEDFDLCGWKKQHERHSWEKNMIIDLKYRAQGVFWVRGSVCLTPSEGGGIIHHSSLFSNSPLWIANFKTKHSLNL